MIIKDLDWSEASPPNKECSYDHVCADSVWKYSIEWKSWKDYPAYNIYRDGDFISSADSLDEAKTIAFESHTELLLWYLSAVEKIPDTWLYRLSESQHWQCTNDPNHAMRIMNDGNWIIEPRYKVVEKS